MEERECYTRIRTNPRRVQYLHVVKLSVRAAT